MHWSNYLLDLECLKTYDNNTHTQAYLSSTEAYDEISDGSVLSLS